MNIILFSQFFSSTKGGGEYLFKVIAKVLVQKGHKVWVITNKVKGETYEEVENLKIITVSPTLEYRGGLPPTFLDNIRYVFNAYRAGRKITKNQNINIIHSNNFSPALAGSLLSYFRKIPHIITIFDIFSQSGNIFWKKWAEQSNVSKINAILVPFFEKIQFKISHDAIYTISDASKKDILKMNPKKPIYNIAPTIEDEILLNKNINPFQFVYVGRLVFYKNVEVLLKAFKIVINEFSNAKLVVVGDGPHKKSLQTLTNNLEINDNIIFMGYVTKNEKTKTISESNAMLFPSLIEGFGLVMLESFQQKRPVLVSNIPPLSDIIIENNTGLIIDPYDEKKWADQIIRLIKDQTISDIMGNEGYHTLKTEYNEKIFYDRLLKMYNDIVN
jgi:glycosyltransferase involved in cell wall biosynthesis